MLKNLFAMWLITSSITLAAPTTSGMVVDGHNRLPYDIESQCSRIKCLSGGAVYNETTDSCSCPVWTNNMLLNPCLETVCNSDTEPFYSFLTDSCECWSTEDMKREQSWTNAMQRDSYITRRYSTTISKTRDYPVEEDDRSHSTSNTNDNIRYSSTKGSQETAVVSSVIPYFLDSVISYVVQVSDSLAYSITMNASTSMVCGGISNDPNLAVVLVPKTIEQGKPQVFIPDCQIIAVNMYKPKTITYWIQKEDGSIYRVNGKNEVRDFHKLDTNAPPELAIVTTRSAFAKRDLDSNVQTISSIRRQIFSVNCSHSCPFYHMTLIKGVDGYCGCVFKGAEDVLHLSRRGIVAPNEFTATMTAAACAAMNCTNNGGRAAVFNPFSLTCWCNTPMYAEKYPSAWVGRDSV